MAAASSRTVVRRHDLQARVVPGDGCFRVVGSDGTVGLGQTRDEAWDDARRNLTAVVPEVVRPGSPTWSLKSDEVYWRR